MKSSLFLRENSAYHECAVSNCNGKHQNTYDTLKEAMEHGWGNAPNLKYQDGSQVLLCPECREAKINKHLNR